MSLLQYKFSWEKANSQLLHILFEIDNNADDVLEIRLPSWRPGRYEISNFAKNIVCIKAYDSAGNSLKMKKLSKDIWSVNCDSVKKIFIEYTYHAAILNAGSTWLDDQQLYVNPVNCCLFIPNRATEACSIHLDLPSDYKVAIDVQSDNNSYLFESFDRLADTPFIASPSLKHLEFDEQGHHFHLWFQGVMTIPENRLIGDFKAFASEQLKTMAHLPGKDYHFMFQILPYAFYHGVEHTYSTVCALGPAINVFESPMYDEFLGVSSHELFHAWNVKTIRPKEMSPYRFSEENYSTLGWIYEGVTTWYGDIFLLRSGVFDERRFINTFNEKLNRHFGNYGRFNLSVAESSFDTWLDGYVAGVPHRKTSIYIEGSLISFILDARIREYTNDEKSLDDFMRRLFEDAKNNRPYTRARLIEILDNLAPLNHEEFFEKYVEGTNDFEPLISSSLARIGLKLKSKEVLSKLEHQAGLKLKLTENGAEVLLIAPNSPAEASGIMTGDELISINSIKFNLAFRKDLLFNDAIEIHAFSQSRLKTFHLSIKKPEFFISRELAFDSEATDRQKQAYKQWSKKDFPTNNL